MWGLANRFGTGIRFFGFGCLLVSVTSQTDAADQVATLIDFQKDVMVHSPPNPEGPATMNQTLRVHDRITTYDFSTAIIRFTNNIQTKMRELTVLEILPPVEQGQSPFLNLLRGALYYFSRDRKSRIGFKTRKA